MDALSGSISEWGTVEAFTAEPRGGRGVSLNLLNLTNFNLT